MAFADELTDMRAVQESYLPDTCTVKRRVMDKDSLGAADPAWSTASWPCRIATGPQTETLAPSGVAFAAPTHAVATFASDADVQAHDRIVVGTESYEVLDVLVNSYTTALRALLRRLE